MCLKAPGAVSIDGGNTTPVIVNGTVGAEIVAPDTKILTLFFNSTPGSPSEQEFEFEEFSLLRQINVDFRGLDDPGDPGIGECALQAAARLDPNGPIFTLTTTGIVVDEEIVRERQELTFASGVEFAPGGIITFLASALSPVGPCSQTVVLVYEVLE